MVNITLRQCFYFEAVAEQGGVAQAARALNLSQPAVAQAMDKLEALCDFPLFIRHHAKGFELTSKGRAFRLQAQAMIRQAQQLEQAIEAIHANRKGSIRLGCFQSIAPFYVASIVKQYRQSHPEINIEVSELLHDQLISKLLENELDLAILYNLELQNHALSWQRLAEARPYLILPPTHRLAKTKTVPLKDLEQDGYVLFDAPGSQEYFYRLFSHIGIKPTVSFRSTSLESVRSAVANGLGFSILSMRPDSSTSYDGNPISSVEIADNIESTPIVIAQNATVDLAPLHHDFIRYCVGQFDEGTAGKDAGKSI